MAWALQTTRPGMLAAASAVAAASVIYGWKTLGTESGILLAATLSLAVATPGLARVVSGTAAARSFKLAHELAILRQFVPAPIANCIERGESLDSGEREVTVMFIDLRGYTALTENLRPEEVFSFINRYTETVSRIVHEHGGFVVEFNGDGLMAVYGAPVPLHHKERAALEAAHAVVAAVQSLEVGSERHRSGHVAVGIGIATGPAFVGRIHAADRCVWSAVGTTTNLASRLEALSRDVGAWIVIDAATRAAAGFDPELVTYESVEIRGLSTRLDLYALPRRPRMAGIGLMGIPATRWSSTDESSDSRVEWSPQRSVRSPHGAPPPSCRAMAGASEVARGRIELPTA